MATENHQYQVVRDDEKDFPSDGEWEVVHDCHTPSMIEIKTKNAAVGTTWKCGGLVGCGDQWKLILHAKHGTFVGNGQDQLQWIRITPRNKENGE